MHVPLIDISRYRATQAAKSMLNYPLKYFTNTRNIKRLSSILEGDKLALKVVDLISKQQAHLANHLDFSYHENEEFKLVKNIIENQSDKYVAVESHLCPSAPLELSQIGATNITERMNLNLAESLNGVGVSNKSIKDGLIFSEILNCAWLVDHFAMYLVGAVDLEETEESIVTFKPKQDEQFIPLWFGNSLEQSSLQAGNFSIAKLAESSRNPSPNDQSLTMLHARVLGLVEQHWKLKSSTISEKIFPQKADLIMILLGAYQNHLFQDSPRPISSSDIKRLIQHSPNHHGLLETYRTIKRFQKTLPSEDRLFEIENEGLILGPTEAVRGLIQQVEHFAKNMLGAY